MKYLPLVWAGLWRNPLRTIFTVLALVAAFTLFGFLQGISTGFDMLVATARMDRIVTFTRYGAPLPLAYKNQIEQLPGVKSVTSEASLAGTIGGDPNRRMFVGMDDDGLFDFFPEYNVTPAQLEEMRNTRNGVIISARVAQLWGDAKVGDRLTMRSNVARKDGGTDWEFQILAIVDRSDIPGAYGIAMGNLDYLEEERVQGKGTVGQFLVLLHDPTQAVATAEAIDAMFLNSGAPTFSIVDKLAQAEGRADNGIVTMVNAIVLATLFALLLVTGNALIQTFRERIPEFGTLKAIGFNDRSVLFLVLTEAVVQCMVGAAMGLVIARAAAPSVKKLLSGPAGLMVVPWSLILLGLLLAFLVALVSAAVPAWQAGRMRIIDALAGR